MSEKRERFIKLMKTIFELDKSDLDFGIYRIMNIRKAEIERFLSEGINERIDEILAPYAQSDAQEIKKRIEEIEKQASDFGISDISASPMAEKYAGLKAQLSSGTDLAELEADVYSCLFNFFNRYYDEGDFISKRRYKEGVYAIPYEGEEVKLYWANQDQYYIKTSENFKDYTFIVDGYSIHFRIVDATTEQNNNKESDSSKRKFMLFTEDEENFPGIRTFEFSEEKKEFIIRFVYDIPEDKKAKYEELNYAAIREYVFNSSLPFWQTLLAPIRHEKLKEYNLLRRHLNAYVAKNTFDYFIHKDLKGFLERELDFYIKNEIMHLDDLDTSDEKRVETYLAKVRVVKRIGKVIINFLAQIENFQKKLWLKKKFIIDTNWCITLDNIGEEFYPEIAANKAQVREWCDMYAADEIEADLTAVGFSNPPSVEFMKQNLNLVVDTKHFDADFKERLIASIDDLDEKTGGVMINSDNFQALNSISERFSKSIEYVYIDPPYNTDSAPILYKNGYKNSSWCSLINERINKSKPLLSEKAVYTVAIDDTEMPYLELLIKQSFTDHRISTITVVHNPKGSPTKDFNRTHEYAIFITKEEDKNAIMRIMEENETPRKMRRWGENSLRTERRLSFYPIYVKNGKIIRVGEIPDDDYHPNSRNVVQDDGSIAIYPIDQNGIERRWNFGLDTVNDNISRITILEVDDTFDLFLTHEMTIPKTVWKGGEYDAGSYGNTLLSNILGSKLFDFPKSINTVAKCINISLKPNGQPYILDFFAGSGTTGHAVINLNREDGGSRKYILVEMGEYFNTVTLPRMKKVVYSADWKNGKPQSRNTGVSHIMKYMKLESYEDALTNISLDDERHGMASLFGDDYLINYMLDVEAEGSLLKLDEFRTPFEYKLKVTENNETKEKNIDLVETFNYLIGLTVKSMSTTVYFDAENDPSGSYEGAVRLVKNEYGRYGFRQIEGTSPDGKSVLVIWRTISEDPAQSNAALDAYFAKHRINPQDREYDLIYVNGDNNLQNLRSDDEAWKVQMTETEFKKRMFEEA